MQLSEVKKAWVNRQNQDIAADVEAWDSVAPDYVCKKIPALYRDPFFAFLTDKITLTKEMTSLDIGCGAGVYTVALAPYVKNAYGVDFSPSMIALANRLAKAEKADNAVFHCENWHTYAATAWENKFDIVFAHMTPAITDFTTFAKMIGCSKKYCFMEKPCRRKDHVFDALRERLGLSSESAKEESVPYAFAALWAMGYSPELAYRKEVWNSDKGVAEAKRWYLGRLKSAHSLSAEAEKEALAYLESIAVEGRIKEEIHTTVVSMFWEKE